MRTHQYNNNVSVVEKNEPNGKIVTTTKTIVKKVITKTNTKNDEPTIIQSIDIIQKFNLSLINCFLWYLLYIFIIF